jgi:hypothetical protein
MKAAMLDRRHQKAVPQQQKSLQAVDKQAVVKSASRG